MRNLCLFLCLVLLLSLCGCKNDPPAPSAAATTIGPTVESEPAGTTVPVTTTAPAPFEDPTVRVETTAQALRVQDTIELPAIRLSDTSSETVIDRKALNGMEMTYVHLPAAGATAVVPYSGEVFWVAQEGDREMNRGNHYILYAEEEDSLVPLENKEFSGSFTLFGQTISLNFSYAAYGDHVYITHVPVQRELGNWAQPCTVGGRAVGGRECLIRFIIITEEGVYLNYYAYVDLTTGEMNDIWAGADPAIFSGKDLLLYARKEDGTLVTYDSGQRWVLWDPNDKTVSAYDPAEYLPGVTVTESTVTSGSIVWTDGKNLWRLDLETNTLGPVLEKGNLQSFYRGVSVAVYRKDGAFGVYDLENCRDLSLPDANQLVNSSGPMGRFVLYSTNSNTLCVLDVEEAAVFALPEEFAADQFDCRGVGEGGDQLLIATSDRFLVFDGETNGLTEVVYSDPDRVFGYLQWTEEGCAIFLHSEDRREFLILR